MDAGKRLAAKEDRGSADARAPHKQHVAGATADGGAPGGGGGSSRSSGCSAWVRDLGTGST